MNARRLRFSLLALLLLAVSAATGCEWARQRISWESPWPDERRDTFPDENDFARQREDDLDSLKEIQQQRAGAEAKFRAANPGVLPPRR